MALTFTTKASIKEREFLLGDSEPTQTAFSPRAIHRLAVVKAPCTNAKIEVHHRVRGSPIGTNSQPAWGYQAWLEISRLPPLFPVQTDKPYNSDLWRKVASDSVSEEHLPKTRSKCTMGSPSTPIPPPSRMTENTFLKFLASRVLLVDDKRKEQVISRTSKDLRESERLKLRSQCRDPPRDSRGYILPPKDFKRYPIRGSLKKQPMGSSRGTSDDSLHAASHQHLKPTRLTLEENNLMYQQLLTRYHEIVTPRSEAPHCNSRMTTEWNMWGYSN
ncbi:hypothetical protein NDU88_006346 [Pleurodeles waltl]|uniref:Uncharacterized protein n=1 Tax=Pleurodeles waltl TaxID=8319 RepID=A0AAV7SPC0_PLEWA|nr:hypothetical protein NDU88_006346 [Pleurodeles waltl]